MMWTALRARVAQPAVAQLRSSLSLSTPRPSLLPFRRSMASHTIPVPPVADSISEGTLAALSVPEGASVAVDQVIAVLDTDKVSVDIRSTVAGKATKWHGAVGDNIKVGAPLLTVELGAEGSAPAASAPASSEAPKPTAPVLTPAGKPSADVDRVKHSPRAESGAQAPTSIFPMDPLDTNRRQPSIAFRYGKRDPAGSVGGSRAGATHQHQGNQPAPVSAADFLSANEAAATAFDALPARYKTRRLKPQQLDVIELGGAENYESKKKAKA